MFSNVVVDTPITYIITEYINKKFNDLEKLLKDVFILLVVSIMSFVQQ